MHPLAALYCFDVTVLISSDSNQITRCRLGRHHGGFSQIDTKVETRKVLLCLCNDNCLSVCC